MSIDVLKLLLDPCQTALREKSLERPLVSSRTTVLIVGVIRVILIFPLCIHEIQYMFLSPF